MAAKNKIDKAQQRIRINSARQEKFLDTLRCWTELGVNEAQGLTRLVNLYNTAHNRVLAAQCYIATVRYFDPEQ